MNVFELLSHTLCMTPLSLHVRSRAPCKDPECFGCSIFGHDPTRICVGLIVKALDEPYVAVAAETLEEAAAEVFDYLAFGTQGQIEHYLREMVANDLAERLSIHVGDKVLGDMAQQAVEQMVEQYEPDDNPLLDVSPEIDMDEIQRFLSESS